MRKTLPFNAQIISQDTYYWCGPATVQNILSSRKWVGEQQLAREMGTTVNGTDHIGLLRNCLNAHLPAAKYQTRMIPGNSATQGQIDTFWNDLVRSINAGYAVAMNWVAPPGNYPRGINGSSSPNYSGGTVYHYVTAMGYDDSNKTVFIVDSGFWPGQYWVSLTQCAHLIASKGYAYATAGPTTPSGNSNRVEFELTNRFKTRVNGSSYADTFVGYVLNSDAATFRNEEKLTKIENQIRDIMENIK